MKPTVIWLTGLSGAGKTTIAKALFEYIKKQFPENSNIVNWIDGDELRKERTNLGFSRQDRDSNVFHAVYKAFTFIDKCNGIISIVSLISQIGRAHV